MRRGSKKNRLLDYWLGIPLLNLLATFRPRHKSLPQNPHRIGVMCSPALGDTLLFSAALQDIRAHFPTAHLVHFCMKPNLAAAELLPGADKRVILDLTNPRQSIAALRAEHIDLFLDFTSWQRLTAFLTMMSGAKFTVGFETPAMHRSRGYDRTAPHRNGMHEVENFRTLLRSLNIPTGAPPAIVLPPAPAPFPEETDVVVFHLWPSGARSWLREWTEPAPADSDTRWLQLADRLATPNTLFVITGAPSDLERNNLFVAKLQAASHRARTFTGTDGFRTLAHLLQQARVVVTVNTGVMHLAAIVGAPTVSINGPNSNTRWGPIGPRAIGVESPGQGCGYLHLGFNFDGQPTDCMQRITVDMVAAAAEQVAQLPPTRSAR